MHKRYRTSTKRLQAKLRRIIHDRLRNYATFKYGKLIIFFKKCHLHVNEFTEEKYFYKFHQEINKSSLYMICSIFKNQKCLKSCFKYCKW